MQPEFSSVRREIPIATEEHSEQGFWSSLWSTNNTQEEAYRSRGRKKPLRYHKEDEVYFQRLLQHYGLEVIRTWSQEDFNANLEYTKELSFDHIDDLNKTIEESDEEELDDPLLPPDLLEEVEFDARHMDALLLADATAAPAAWTFDPTGQTWTDAYKAGLKSRLGISATNLSRRDYHLLDLIQWADQVHLIRGQNGAPNPVTVPLGKIVKEIFAIDYGWDVIRLYYEEGRRPAVGVSLEAFFTALKKEKEADRVQTATLKALTTLSTRSSPSKKTGEKKGSKKNPINLAKSSKKDSTTSVKVKTEPVDR